jgi:PadR family transcriptional regulator, regulatory protein PadR
VSVGGALAPPILHRYKIYMPRQLGSSTLLVLQALVRGYRYGFDIMDATGLPSGTVYPILSRLEELGLARSAWEDQRIAVKEKRPPRKYYRITAAGTAAAEEAVRRVTALPRPRGAGGRDPSPARG